MQKNYYL